MRHCKIKANKWKWKLNKCNCCWKISIFFFHLRSCWFTQINFVFSGQYLFITSVARVLALCKSYWTAMNKIFIYARPCVNKMTWAVFVHCRSVIKEFAHAFSCAYIELWMHLGSLESTQKAGVAPGCASSYSYAFFVLSKLPKCIHNSIYAR